MKIFSSLLLPDRTEWEASSEAEAAIMTTWPLQSLNNSDDYFWMTDNVSIHPRYGNFNYFEAVQQEQNAAIKENYIEFITEGMCY